MLFRFAAKRVDVRAQQWEEFAADFELKAAAQLRGRLRQRFSLGEGELAPIYALERAGQPLIIVFDQRRDRSGPTGSVTTLRTCVALKGTQPHGSPSMRAAARRSAALEALEASRSGAQRLRFEENPAFDARASIYARDELGARSVLTPQVLTALERLLSAADEAVISAGASAGEMAPLPVAPSLVMGERDLLLTLEPRAPLPLPSLGGLLTDLLSLHVALRTGALKLSRALLE